MDERQHLFDQIVQEIREREEFLEEMDKYGKRHKYERQINAEIAQVRNKNNFYVLSPSFRNTHAYFLVIEYHSLRSFLLLLFL